MIWLILFFALLAFNGGFILGYFFFALIKGKENSTLKDDKLDVVATSQWKPTIKEKMMMEDMKTLFNFNGNEVKEDE